MNIVEEEKQWTNMNLELTEITLEKWGLVQNWCINDTQNVPRVFLVSQSKPQPPLVT